MSKTNKEFKPSSWAIDHSTTIYVLTAILFFVGLSAYYSLPRESMPEIKETKIYVSTAYPGNTAEDIEKLIVDPLEKKLKNISNVTEITATAQEDYGMIVVEFDENISVESAKIRVKDEVDAIKASEDWPFFNNAKVDPNVFELNFSEEIPILNINITGNYPTQQLKKFGEYLEDQIETFSEIKQVDIRGAEEKEVEIAVDIYKMMAAKVSFNDVIGAVRNGNVTLSAGNIIVGNQRRTIRVLGEIATPNALEDFVVKSDNGAVYLKDIATVAFKSKNKTTYARLYGNNVVMLDVKKRAGKNMVAAAEKVNKVVTHAVAHVFPSDLNITITNDQSSKTINQVDDLVNNIIFGVLLVVIVLMFFLGFRNALFVGFAIPMSMFMSFMIVEMLGYTMNTMVLFALIMGLGMLVDNGIVVVENAYRLIEKEGLSRIQASKKGIGEIAYPIIISTITTVAAFVPLGLWPGVMGQFMIYFPITLSIVLGSSLFVAVFINSVLISQFMSVEQKVLSNKQLVRLTFFLGVPGILLLLFGGSIKGLGSLLILVAILFWLYKLKIKQIANYFQLNLLVRLENWYEKKLRAALKGAAPVRLLLGTLVMLILSFVFFGMSIGSGRTKIEFFPDNKPNQVIVYIEYPQGTDIEKTNQLTKSIENRVIAVVNQSEYLDKEHNFLVESVISQVGEGAGNPFTDGGSAAEMPHKGKVTISMRAFKYRKGADSEVLRAQIQENLKGIYPGVAISVEKDAVGPPVGYPVNIEISGDDYGQLITTAEQMRAFINQKEIEGIDEIKIDVNKNKPAITVDVDRRKAGELGVSVNQVGSQLRQSLFGDKAGVYKEKGENYDVYVRFNEENRYDKNALFNQKITFRDPATGKIKEIPIASVASHRNTTSFSAIKHRNAKRIVTMYSALAPGFSDATAVVNQLKTALINFQLPENVQFKFTGQIEEQNEQQEFLNWALMMGLALIILILVFQFSAVSKPLIVLVTILLSFTGVFLGLIASGMPFVIMMTMMGIISLAGVVVNNGVVLLDYTQLLIDRKKEALNLSSKKHLPKEHMLEAIIGAGKARLRPVLLTAITTVFGLIPLAIGLNVDFFSLFSNFDPKIYVGGDNVIFWGPLAWTVIFGLTFATFLTLIVVPIQFYLGIRLKMWLFEKK